MRLFCVAQIKIPDLDAAARYTPLFDRARAVMSPVQASSDSVEDLDQSVLDIVAISAFRL